MFVKDIERLPNTGASRLIRFLISNWSNGLIIFEKKFIKRKKNVNIYLNKESSAHKTKDTKGTKDPKDTGLCLLVLLYLYKWVLYFFF